MKNYMKIVKVTPEGGSYATRPEDVIVFDDTDRHSTLEALNQANRQQVRACLELGVDLAHQRAPRISVCRKTIWEELHECGVIIPTKRDWWGSMNLVSLHDVDTDERAA